MKLSKGIEALTTVEEQKEIFAVNNPFIGAFSGPNHSTTCDGKHPRIRFAFFQLDLDGAKIPYWHVLNEGQSHHSTLSMAGLKQWGLL